MLSQTQFSRTRWPRARVVGARTGRGERVRTNARVAAVGGGRRATSSLSPAVSLQDTLPLSFSGHPPPPPPTPPPPLTPHRHLHHHHHHYHHNHHPRPPYNVLNLLCAIISRRRRHRRLFSDRARSTHRVSDTWCRIFSWQQSSFPRRPVVMGAVVYSLSVIIPFSPRNSDFFFRAALFDSLYTQRITDRGTRVLENDRPDLAISRRAISFRGYFRVRTCEHTPKRSRD